MPASPITFFRGARTTLDSGSPGKLSFFALSLHNLILAPSSLFILERAPKKLPIFFFVVLVVVARPREQLYTSVRTSA